LPPEAPIPLTVIGGYLGSGKTTLINRIIAADLIPGLCVIVNDFGELDIDAEILRRSDGLTLTLANGCVCCSAASGLYDAFEAALNADPKPRHIILEASGVADPARLSAIARAEPALEARAVVTVADCLAIERDIDDPIKKPDILRQLRAADLILLSKADLAPQASVGQVRELISGIAPTAPIEALGEAALPDALTLAFNTAPTPRLGTISAPHDPEARYETCSFQGPAIECLDALLRDIDALPSSIIRLKGIIKVSGETDPQIVDLAGARASVARLPGRACARSLLTAIFARGSGAQAAIAELARRHFGKDGQPEPGANDRPCPSA
jgi:G3E family GTPase